MAKGPVCISSPYGMNSGRLDQSSNTLSGVGSTVGDEGGKWREEVGEKSGSVVSPCPGLCCYGAGGEEVLGGVECGWTPRAVGTVRGDSSNADSCRDVVMCYAPHNV